MATNTGYGGFVAGSFDMPINWGEIGSWVEIQVHPNLFRIYLSDGFRYKRHVYQWSKEQGRNLALAVIDGKCPAYILADWCDENRSDLPYSDSARESLPGLWLREV